MTDFSRIERLFHEACALPPEARGAFLLGNETDAAIRIEVEKLLANDDANGNPLAQRLHRALTASTPVPQWIGRYRIVEPLGEGGMASVFLAERDVDGRAQRVALKLMSGNAGATFRRKAIRERTLLAALNHRGIAGFIDGGETDDGVPFLVMEYVEGLPLPRFLAERRPDTRERLQLFRQICDAIEHAHQRLILHLDLKPSNVLVRKDGSISLIDFGIGRELEEDAAQTQAAAYTPIYAAPEQRSGESPTTATDVYAAGLLLFEILSDGGLSERKRRKQSAAIAAILSEKSTRTSIPGDLRRAIACATEARPADRYPSIAAFRADIDHFLAGRMLSASRQAWWVRTGKFCRRNAWRLTAAGAVATMACVFVLQLSAQRSRALAAEQSALLAQDMQSSLLVALSPSGNPQAHARIQALLERERVRQQDERAQHAFDARWRSIASIVVVAEIYVAIGDPEPALKSADAARRLLADMQRSRPHIDDDLLARTLAARGQALNRLERYQEAETDFERMLTLRKRNSSRDPQALATAWMLYGKAAIEWRDFAKAEQALEKAGSLAGDIETPSDSGRTEAADEMPIELAIAQLDAASESDDMSRLGTQRRGTLLALADARLAATSPIWIEVRMALSRWHQVEGEPDIALAEAERALTRSRQLFGERSAVTATIENNIGTMLVDLGRYRDALARFDLARGTQARLSPDKATVLASIDINRSRALYALGEYAEAADSARAALDALPETHAVYRRLRSIGLSNLARSQSELGQHPAAIRAARRMLSDPWLRTTTPLDSAFGKISMFVVMLNAGALDEAQSILDDTTPILEKNLPADHPGFIYMARRRGLLAAARGRFEEADQAFATALARMEASHDDPVTRAEILVARAQAVYRLGDQVRARSLLKEALPILRKEVSPNSQSRLDAEALLPIVSAVGPVLQADSE